MTSAVQLQADIRSQRRGALSRHPTLTGIDYIEVQAVLPGQWELLVHFVPSAPEVPQRQAIPPGITSDNIVIRGRGGAVETRLRVTAVTYPENGGNVLTVAVTSTEGGRAAGDASDFPAYALELVHVPSLDRFFSSRSFAFAVDAPSDLPPVPAGALAPVLAPATSIDYLAKDYESFRKLILDRMTVRVPQWTERNPVDLGMALVELLAYAGDYLSYYQDAVATEAYIGTARQRVSVARHARLLDYYMHQGCNARVWVQVQVTADLTLAAGTPLLTSVRGHGPRVPTQFYNQVLQQRPRVFETMHAVELLEAHNRLSFYTWGAAEYLLPRGATGATLQGHFPGLKTGDVLILEEVVGPATGRPSDTDVKMRHAVRLDNPPVLGTDPLQDNAPITEIQWADEDALPFTLVVAAYIGDRLREDLSVALGNIVLADHGRTLEGERLPVVPESGPYRPGLEWRDLTYRVPHQAEEVLSQGATSALRQSPPDALPAISLLEHPPEELLGGVGRENEERLPEWTPRRDLMHSGRFTREFKVELREDGSVSLLFGDGKLGKKPSAGTFFSAQYRIGNGAAGNLGHETLSHIVSDDDGVIGVRNPMPAQGGTAPESLEEARLYAPRAFYRQERCVTEEDYVAIAERHPEVQKAAAMVRWTGSWHTVYILVDRYEGRPVDEEFQSAFTSYLDRYRMSGYDLDIRPPYFVPLDIALTVFVEPGYFRSRVRQTLIEIFSNTTSPDGQQGFFHPDNLTFGQSVYQSQVVTTAARVPGVMRVDVTRFASWGGPAGGMGVVKEIAVRPFEVARLDNDPSAPWNGTIRFNVVGGW